MEHFCVAQLPADPAFRRFLPICLRPHRFPVARTLRAQFRPPLQRPDDPRGHPDVSKSGASVFLLMRRSPWGEKKSSGCLGLHPHHPINMECGDPRGALGRGFVPPYPVRSRRHCARSGLSCGPCHVPLDIHLSETRAHRMRSCALTGGLVVGRFLPYCRGHACWFCQIPPTPLLAMCSTGHRTCRMSICNEWRSRKGPDCAYCRDRGWRRRCRIDREADRLGADCLIAGEVTSKIDNDLGRRRQAEIDDYLLMDPPLLRWPFARRVRIPRDDGDRALQKAPCRHSLAEAVPESNWWRWFLPQQVWTRTEPMGQTSPPRRADRSSHNPVRGKFT